MSASLAPRIQHRAQSSISPVLRLRAGPIAHGMYHINYRFAGEPDVEGEIIARDPDEAWSIWRTVLDAHEQGGRT